ncbi:MAG: hypothetical protein OXI54_03575 [Chloroflexota bacterium]|nr:hypothetical protein [Chloroflexota bacterium]
MSDAKKYSGKSKPAGGDTELRFAGVEFKPAPDAQDRLRRLFTILAAHFAERDQVEDKRDHLANGQPSDDDDRGAE